MNPETYAQLPPDVKDDLGDLWTKLESIPTGVVRVTEPDGASVDVEVKQFVRQMRRARKVERQNRKRGRR